MLLCILYLHFLHHTHKHYSISKTVYSKHFMQEKLVVFYLGLRQFTRATHKWTSKNGQVLFSCTLVTCGAAFAKVAGGQRFGIPSGKSTFRETNLGISVVILFLLSWNVLKAGVWRFMINLYAQEAQLQIGPVGKKNNLQRVFNKKLRDGMVSKSVQL